MIIATKLLRKLHKPHSRRHLATPTKGPCAAMRPTLEHHFRLPGQPCFRGSALRPFSLPAGVVVTRLLPDGRRRAGIGFADFMPASFLGARLRPTAALPLPLALSSPPIPDGGRRCPHGFAILCTKRSWRCSLRQFGLPAGVVMPAGESVVRIR